MRQIDPIIGPVKAWLIGTATLHTYNHWTCIYIYKGPSIKYVTLEGGSEKV